MTVLVTGGAGYIGSHVAHALVDRGREVVVIDDLSTGARSLVPRSAKLVIGDFSDGRLLDAVFRAHDIFDVLHFAGSVVVPESVTNPLKYYENNTAKTGALLASCVAHGAKTFIFSSTAAVYGTPQRVPVSEQERSAPINPYGRSKLMIEWMLQDVAAAHNMRFAALRYFNVAGADLAGRTGQSTPNATHLIKRACQAALGRLKQLEIYGSDFPTKDGTGIRDYIHVTDLSNAHLLALDYLKAGGSSLIANVGYGDGFSVLEVITAVEHAHGKRLPVLYAPRRPGDPPELMADSTLLKQTLGWVPQHASLSTIVSSALAWERRLGEPGSVRPLS